MIQSCCLNIQQNQKVKNLFIFPRFVLIFIFVNESCFKFAYLCLAKTLVITLRERQTKLDKYLK